MRKLAGVMVMMVSCAATTETTASTEKPSYSSMGGADGD